MGSDLQNRADSSFHRRAKAEAGTAEEVFHVVILRQHGPFQVRDSFAARNRDQAFQ